MTLVFNASPKERTGEATAMRITVNQLTHVSTPLLLGIVGLLGMAAVISRPDASAPDVLPTLIGTAVGIDTLVRLRPRLPDPLARGVEDARDRDLTR